jgi:hypothetical protein
VFLLISTPRARRLAAVSVLVVATTVRAPLVTPSLPYLGYIDEGHVLHHVAGLLRAGGWDPGWYAYPSLTLYVIAGCVCVLDWIVRAAGGNGILVHLSTGTDFYDFVTPPALIVTGRLVVLAASMGIVFLGMALAHRLAGERARLIAGLFLALCPALVQRSPIVIVDTVAAALALGALLAALRLLPDSASNSPRVLPYRWALAAGALSGLAAAAKYPAGAVLLAVLTTIALLRTPVITRVQLGLMTLAAALGGAVLGMPALVLRPRAVLDALREQALHYANPSIMSPDAVPKPSLLVQTFERYELGLVLPIVGIVGLAILLGRRETRRVAIPWILFGVALLVPVLSFPFQPFRNVLALVPLLIIAAAMACDAVWRLGRAGAFGRSFLSVVVVASFVPGLFLVFRVLGTRDTRVVLVDRLAPMLRPEDRVLVVRELAILPAELARLRANTWVVPWNEVRTAAEGSPWNLVVYGRIDPGGFTPTQGGDVRSEVLEVEAWLESLPRVLRIGSAPTPLNPFFFRSNDELLIVARPPEPRGGSVTH